MIPLKFKEAEFKELEYRTIQHVDGLHAGSPRVTFGMSNGDIFELHHEQECCERVEIESIIGDASELNGEVVLKAEKKVVPGTDSRTEATFFELSTRKGTVQIRWTGESDSGAYALDVDFAKLEWWT